jgi:hypothetical protein
MTQQKEIFPAGKDIFIPKGIKYFLLKLAVFKD